MLFQYFGLLDRFGSDTDELDLSHGERVLKIRKISKKELEDSLLRPKYEFSHVNDIFEQAIAFGKDRYWIDYHYEVEDSRDAVVKASNAVYEEMEETILALRLFKEGLVRIVFYVSKLSEGERVFSPSVRVLRSDDRPCLLKSSELPIFKDLQKDLASKSLTHLNIALSRLTDGYERLKLEDRIIDYMIGLESLYFREEESGEFGYKLAHRLSVLLADDKKERQHLFENTKKSYKLRSKIVHGSKYKLSQEDVWFVEDKLRLSIRKFLVTPKPNWLNLIF